jgi:hypothetical protein
MEPLNLKAYLNHLYYFRTGKFYFNHITEFGYNEKIILQSLIRF